MPQVLGVGSVLPTGYGLGGYDPFLSHMCIGLGYGLLFATSILLFLVLTLYIVAIEFKQKVKLS